MKKLRDCLNHLNYPIMKLKTVFKTETYNFTNRIEDLNQGRPFESKAQLHLIYNRNRGSKVIDLYNKPAA